MGCTERREEWRRVFHIKDWLKRCDGGGADASPHGPKDRSDSGFTYLELVVVMAILSLLFFFSLPRLDSYLFTDPSKKVARLIAATVQDLKRRASTNRKEYRLYIAPDTGELWVTDAIMDEAKALESRKNGFTIPEDMTMTLRGLSPSSENASGEVMVRFYPLGYSDGVDILLTYGEETLRLEVEPFLSQVEIVMEDEDGF